MLHERGQIEIFGGPEENEPETFAFRRIPPPPSIGGWHYGISYWNEDGTMSADASAAARHNCEFIGVNALVRRVERGEFVEYDVFTSVPPETEMEIPPNDLIGP